MIHYLDLKKQYLSIKDEIDVAIASVIETSAFVGGRAVKDFENNFAEYHGVPHAIGVGNGTDALEIAIQALDLPKGSEVIVPSMTFMGSSEAVSRNGLKIVFADIDLKTYTLDPEDVVKRVTSKTSAIMPVHLYGHPCDMGAILEIAHKHKLKVIEDCAQAHGALYKTQPVGTFGDVACFSFYPGKNLGAYGDGGLILARDNLIAERSRMIANHGRSEKYDHQIEGRNSRLDGLQAAILNVKLKYLDEWNCKRRMVAEWYSEELKELSEVQLPLESKDVAAVYHVYGIRCGLKRDRLKDYLHNNQIQTGVHYPKALSQQKAYENEFLKCEAFFSHRLSSEILSLPIGEHVTKKDVVLIASKIKEFMQQ